MINNDKAMKEIARRILTRVKSGSIQVSKGVQLNGVISLDYDELMQRMKMDDLFYDVILAEMAKRSNTEITFKGRHVVFRKKDGKA